MFRIGNLLRRLQKEADTASPSTKPAPVAEEVVPEPVLQPDVASLDHESSSGASEDDLLPSSKQKRHQARRQRQRERKQLGKEEEITLRPIVTDIPAQSAQVSSEPPLSSSEPQSVNYGSQVSTAWFASSEPNSSQGHFYGSCKWSPTGDRIATVGGENGVLKVFTIPEAPVPTADLELPSSYITQVCSSECIYDYAWYPYSNAQIEGSSLIAIGARSRPVQLWDASNGTLRASYRAYDHLEHICSPNSLAFSIDGSYIYGGFDGVLRAFPIEQPGNNYTEHWTRREKPKSSKRSREPSNTHASHDEPYGHEYSFNGIISTLATSPSNPNALFGGTFSGDIALFDLTTFSQQISIKAGYGVTQVKPSPCGSKLYAAGRKSNQIEAFDLRMPENALWTLQRCSSTNQRIVFDLDCTGSLLMSGSSDGSLKMWNLSLQDTPMAVSIAGLDSYEHDGINCAQFHPFYPSYYAITSGQRRIALDPCYDSDSDSDAETPLPEARSQLFVGYLHGADA